MVKHPATVVQRTRSRWIGHPVKHWNAVKACFCATGSWSITKDFGITVTQKVPWIVEAHHMLKSLCSPMCPLACPCTQASCEHFLLPLDAD